MSKRARGLQYVEPFYSRRKGGHLRPKKKRDRRRTRESRPLMTFTPKPLRKTLDSDRYRFLRPDADGNTVRGDVVEELQGINIDWAWMDELPPDPAQYQASRTITRGEIGEWKGVEIRWTPDPPVKP